VERDGRFGARPGAVRRATRKNSVVPDERTIWKRRAVLMAVIGLIVAVPVTLAIRGGDEEDASPSPPAPELPEVGPVAFDRDLGVRLRVPRGWKRSREQGAITYRSADRSVLVAISSPGPAADARAIQAQAVAAIKREFRGARVLDRTDRPKVGGRPASSAVLRGRRPNGGDLIRVLVATAKGRKRAYLVEVFARRSAALVEAQALLNNLRLRG
jgi:hypothetical protein